VPKEQMNAPDTAGTEPAFRQRFIKGTDVMWLQLGELDFPHTGDDVPVNQIAVSALGVGTPLSGVPRKPDFCPRADCVFFLHCPRLLLQYGQYHRKRKIATAKRLYPRNKTWYDDKKV